MENQNQTNTEQNFYSEKRFDVETGKYITAWGRPLEDIAPPSSLSEVAMEGGLC